MVLWEGWYSGPKDTTCVSLACHTSNRAKTCPEGPAIEKIQSRSKISILARKFQSRSKFSSAIENINPGVSIYVALVVYREGLDRKFQSTIDRSKLSIPKAAIDFFNPRALWVTVNTRASRVSCNHYAKECPSDIEVWIWFVLSTCRSSSQDLDGRVISEACCATLSCSDVQGWAGCSGFRSGHVEQDQSWQHTAVEPGQKQQAKKSAAQR